MWGYYWAIWQKESQYLCKAHNKYSFALLSWSFSLSWSKSGLFCCTSASLLAKHDGLVVTVISESTVWIRKEVGSCCLWFRRFSGFFDCVILVPRAHDPFDLRQESRALGATISCMRHRCRLRETGWAEFGYFLCYFKMVAPRALVFRPLVKGNEALGTRLW